jgi:hypothetical protein
MTATGRDLAALTAALDAGDDTALPALADALEEAELRRAGAAPPEARPDVPGCYRWGWRRDGEASPPGAIFARLLRWRVAIAILDYEPRLSVQGGWVGYPSRSAAFLALSEALAGA